ncbi:MAG: rhodanese-like domain-containing protein [Bacteroidota bacterium]|nr:rhodanese-like domain-containing protein [Bacteroidota bacterium]
MFHAKNPRRLAFALILFSLVIVVGLITMSKPEYAYKNNSAQVLKSILNKEGELKPEKAKYYVEENNLSFVFVDIRNPYEYIKGHVANAINIPLTELLSKETLKTFDRYVRDKITIVIYANTQTEANGSWMLLKQLGYSDIKVLLGGYEYYSKELNENDKMSETPEFYVEIPKYDFAKIAKEASSN